MILGTYHMANPGLDAVNLDADDVLSARRQAEIDRVVRALAEFKPTKVAVEWPYKDQADLSSHFVAYKAGTYLLTRNEVDQLGLRLANAAGVREVNAVDYPMFMSGLTPAELVNEFPAPPRPTQAAATASPSASPRPVSAEDALLRRSTVAAYLAHVNSDTSVAANASSYPNMLAPDSTSAALYAKADLVTNWYKRNLRIFANVNRAVGSFDNRVILIIGAGHIHILSDLALTSTYYCLVSPVSYLAAAR
jgi:hypothetical protein